MLTSPLRKDLLMIIDRFEGNYAVIELENGSFENMPKTRLPANAKEGDCITISIDNNATAERAKRIENKMNRLFRD